MIKKIVMLLAVALTLVSYGCKKGEFDISKVEAELSEKINNLDSYKLEATMEIKKEDSSIMFDVTTYYLKPDFYKVILKNKENNNVQAIVKNETGTYVISPALNKSFKFNGNWPSSSSNSYILQSIIKDIVNDDNKIVTEDEQYVYIENKIDHKINKSWDSQKISISKKTLLPKDILIQDENKNTVVVLTFKNFDLETSLKKNFFDVDNTNETMRIELGEGEVSFEERKILTPTYIPEGYELINESIEEEKAISVFKGDTTYTIVQEFITPSTVLSANRLYGEPVMLEQTVGALTDNSITWFNNGIEYMIFSRHLTKDEMVKIANSFVYGISN